MGYKLKQWIIEDARTGEVWKVRGKSRQSVVKRLGKTREYATVLGTVKSLTKSRRSREELEKHLDKTDTLLSALYRSFLTSNR